jgi:hypothetical protein
MYRYYVSRTLPLNVSQKCSLSNDDPLEHSHHCPLLEKVGQVKSPDVFRALKCWKEWLLITQVFVFDAIATEPSDASAKAAWKKLDHKALSTIQLCITDNVLGYIAGSKSAKTSWETLSNMFEAKGPISIVMARQKFFCTQCPNDDDIESTSGGCAPTRRS